MNDCTTTVEHDGHTLEIETDMIEVTAMVEPDPRWTYTDAEGHLHHAVSAGDLAPVTYPTLELKSGPAQWCESCEDEHTDSWWVCRRCGQKIAPGTREGRTRFIPGVTTYKIDGEYVSEVAAREFADAWQRSLNNQVNDLGLKGLTHDTE